MKSKTNITAVVTGAWNVFYQLNKANGWIEVPEGVYETVNTILGSLIVIFMRQGVAKSGPQSPAKEIIPDSAS